LPLAELFVSCRINSLFTSHNSLFNSLPPVAGHILGKGLIALLLNHGNAGVAVGAKNEAKDSGKDVVIRFAIHRISVSLAIGAGVISILLAAGSHLAPGGLNVVGTAGALPLKV